MREKAKRITSIVLSVLVFVTLLSGLQVSAKDASVIHIDLTGKYHESLAREVLKRMNVEREKERLKPLIMTEKLEDIAKKRAAETFVLKDHQRPNGEGIEAMAAEEGLTWKSVDETILQEGTVVDAPDVEVTGLDKKETYAEDIIWALAYQIGPQREMLMNPDYTHVGIGCFECNGRKGIAIVYAEQPSDTKEASLEGEDDIEQSVFVELNSNIFIGGALAFKEEEQRVNPGTETNLNLLGYFGKEPLYVKPSDITFESSSEAVWVDGHKIVISPEASGEVILTAKAGIYTAEKKLIITDEPLMQPQDSANTGDDSLLILLTTSLVSTAVVFVLAGCIAIDRRRKANRR